MPARFDLVIRNGTIVDGTGAQKFESDIGVRDGKIVSIDRNLATGHEEIEANGFIVTPGFVDIHTHYDGQVTWDERLSPSSWHGVTTAVMGNCGVGFAPCRLQDQSMLIGLMEGVEDIPGAVLTEGLKWNWETFPQYLDALEDLRHDIDFAAQVPHAALRVYVMGARGAKREKASSTDIQSMSEIAREAVRAGALGFSTSRTLNHRTSDGDLTPSFDASHEELIAISAAIGRESAGVLQVISDFTDPAGETGLILEMARQSGRPLTFSLAQSDRAPASWKDMLQFLDNCAAGNLPIRAQVCGRPVGLLLGLSLSLNPFSAHPSYKKIEHLPFQERLNAMRTEAMRTALLTEQPSSDNPFVKAVLRNFSKMFPLNDPPDYEPAPEMSLGAQAAKRNVRPEELIYDWLLQDDGQSIILFPFLNYASSDLSPSYEMMTHAQTVLGLGDGGAHVGMICDGSFPTTMMTHWTRDRQRGPKLSLEWVIQAQTQSTAQAVGLYDRGVIAPGYKADLNIIDYKNLTLHRPSVTFDLPAGGKRLIQKAEGYKATIVSGRITYTNGNPTRELPGKLIRGPRPLP